MAKSIQSMPLPKLDDLFKTEEERNKEQVEEVVKIKISDITDFPKHPFHVNVNEELQELVESIKIKGVMDPVIVRKKGNKYEMIAGHRRKKASEILKLDTIPCIIRDLTDDEAIISMVDSNLHRKQILPSEKAFAYKMKMEALSHQGKRIDLTCDQVGDKLDRKKSVDLIAEESGDSKSQVQRFIRLTYLIPQILKMVDNSFLNEKPSMALNPAVEISYLQEHEQKELLNIMEYYDCTPSHEQSRKLKAMSQEGTLTESSMRELLQEEKYNQVPTLKVSMNKLRHVLPNTLKSDREREDYVIKAVEWYDKYQKRLKERNSQER